MPAFGDLQTALAEEEGFTDDSEAEVFEGFSGDEEVGDSVFVFEGDEAVPFCGAGTLAADDHAGDAQRSAVPETFEIVGGDQFGIGLSLAPKPHRVRAEAGSLQDEVGFKSFGGLHHFEGLLLGVLFFSEEVVEGKLFTLPEGITAVFDFREFIKGADGGEGAALFFVGRNAMEEVIQGGEVELAAFLENAVIGLTADSFQSMKAEA